MSQRPVWFQLVDSTGNPYKEIKPETVSLSPTAFVDELCDAVKSKCTTLLTGISPTNLLVYATFKKKKTTLKLRNKLLKRDASLNGLGSSMKTPLLVVVSQDLEVTHPPQNKLRIENNSDSDILIHMLESIKNAKIIGNWLCFHPSLFFNNETYSKIYIRKAYEDLFDILYRRKIQLNNPVSATVIGTPGIGKSMFLLYCFYRLIQKGHSVVVQHFELDYDIYSSQNEQSHVLGHDDVMDRKNTFFLCDNVRPRRLYNTILVTSPRRDEIHNDFKKRYSHKYYYMPVWSEKEVDVFMDKIDLSKKEKETVKQRYAVFGGVPSHIFNELSSPITDSELEGYVRKCSDIRNVAFLLMVESDRVPEAAHTLVHMVPIENYQRYRYQFASKVFAELMAKYLNQKDMANLTNAIEYLRIHHVGALGSDLFEPWVRFHLSSGTKIKIRPLNETSIGLGLGTKIIPPLESKVLTEVDVSSRLNLSEKELIIPKTTAFNGIDMIFNNFIVNCTVDGSREFVVNEQVSQILSNIKDLDRMSIAFIVPADMFDSYQKQNVVCEEKNGRSKLVERMFRVACDLPQVVVCIME